ncbi:otogelin-like protein [Narcine bancroftii]|uniref:otogelin-like protein n=1 Tax=Narcine bancroftii TaxID=1343680 RepID=UPI00383210FA
MENLDRRRKSNSTGKEFKRIEGDNIVHCFVTGLGNTYISTFNGNQFEFRGHCMYMLLTELNKPSAFSIVLDQQEDCLKGRCTRKVIISNGSLPSLELVNMEVFIQQHGQSFPISYSGMYIYGTQEELFIEVSKELTVFWNGKGTITVALKKQGAISGLCSHSNDVLGHTVAAMWELKQFGLTCITKHAEDSQLCQAAENCLDKGLHSRCSLKTLNILLRACKNDVCWGNEICSSRLMLLRECATGALEEHLTAEMKNCVPECRPTYYLSANASVCPNTCENYWNNSQCRRPGLLGCDCPDGLVSYHGTCVQPHNCPCLYDGQEFENGKSIQLYCLKCDCHGGQMDCSDLECPVFCSVTGSQYITTFTGTRYYFYGGCVHVLVKTSAFVVYLGTNTCQETDNGKCIEYVTLTTKDFGTSVNLTKTGQVFLGQEEIGLPYVYEEAPSLSVRLASSMFLEVLSSTGVHVQYDFKGSRVYVMIQPSIVKETLGLCGMYNRSHLYDFKSLNYLIDSVPRAFVNSWKASPQCVDIPLLPVFEPCQAHPQKGEDFVNLT